MSEDGTARVPHWTQILKDLWERAGAEIGKTVDVREYADENDYDPEIVRLNLEVKPAWDYIESGVSNWLWWFHREYDQSLKPATDRNGGAADGK